MNNSTTSSKQNMQFTLKEKNHLGREKRKKKTCDSLIHIGSSVDLFFNRVVLTATPSKRLRDRSKSEDEHSGQYSSLAGLLLNQVKIGSCSLFFVFLT